MKSVAHCTLFNKLPFFLSESALCVDLQVQSFLIASHMYCIALHGSWWLCYPIDVAARREWLLGLCGWSQWREALCTRSGQFACGPTIRVYLQCDMCAAICFLSVEGEVWDTRAASDPVFPVGLHWCSSLPQLTLPVLDTWGKSSWSYSRIFIAFTNICMWTVFKN